MGALVAGAKYRGEFEERLKAVLKEVQNSEGHIILFMTNCIMSWAGKTEGAMDAGNLLKPMLARGIALHRGHHPRRIPKIHRKGSCTGKTFQQVQVQQPGVEDTISILRG